MEETVVTLINEGGLHARPAARFVQVASTFDVNIRVEKDDRAADGRSLLGLTTLMAYQGTQLKIVARGKEAKQALEALKALVESGFGE